MQTVAQLVQTLPYKPGGRGFDSPWGINLSASTTAPGSNKPLKEMSTRGISWRVMVSGVWGWWNFQIHVSTA